MCDTYWNTTIIILIKLHYIGEYSSTQGEYFSTQELKLKLTKETP